MSLSATTKEALDLDLGPEIMAEMMEGYHDGRDGEPEPGNNRSDWYRHGWLNGRDDRPGVTPRQTATETARDLLDLADKYGLRRSPQAGET